MLRWKCMPPRRSSRRSSLRAMKLTLSLPRSNPSMVKRKPQPTRKIMRWSRKRRKTRASQMRVFFRKRLHSMLRKSQLMLKRVPTLRSQLNMSNRSSYPTRMRTRPLRSRTSRVATPSKRESLPKSRYPRRKTPRSRNKKLRTSKWMCTRMSPRRKLLLPVVKTLRSRPTARRKQRLKTKALRSGTTMRTLKSNPLLLKRLKKRLQRSSSSPKRSSQRPRKRILALT